MLKDLELFEQDETGRIERRFEHGIAAIIDRDWLLLLGREGFEIVRPDQGPRRIEARREPPRQTAAIEGLGSIGSDLLERAGEIGLDYQRAEPRRFALGEKG